MIRSRNHTSILGCLIWYFAVDSKSLKWSANYLKLRISLADNNVASWAIKFIWCFILSSIPHPYCKLKFLACIRHLILEAKSSPTAPLDTLSIAVPSIISTIFTTELISWIEALSASGETDSTWKFMWFLKIHYITSTCNGKVRKTAVKMLLWVISGPRHNCKKDFLQKAWRN